MPLIISPRTYEEVHNRLIDEFCLQKVPTLECRFWHGNFKDNFYKSEDGSVRVLFTGYSGGVVGQGIIEYVSHYLKDDPKKEVYFVGSVFAFKNSKLELGDLVYARDTFSPDSFEQSIYRNAKGKGIEDVTLPDHRLLSQVLRIAEQKGVEVKQSKVYCRISTGYYPKFENPMQLMREGMWYKVAQGKAGSRGCDSGEYESAAIIACCRLFKVPAVAMFDVKDKLYSKLDYRICPSEPREKTLGDMLSIIKESIRTGGSREGADKGIKLNVKS